jgi:hypothetical protein
MTKQDRTTCRDIRWLYWMFAFGAVAAAFVNPTASAGLAGGAVFLVKLAAGLAGHSPIRKGQK